MTGVAARAERLRGLVELTLKREKLLNDARALNGRVTQLENWDQSLRGLLPAARALKVAGSPASVVEDAAALRRSADQALRDFRKDPGTARHPEFDAANIFWGQASRRIGIADATIRTEWRSHVNASMPEYQPAVVRALAGDEASAIEASLAQYARNAATMADRLPSDDEDSGAVAAIAGEIRAVLQRFDLSAESDEVKAFVEAVLAERATIDLLTDSVREWLIKRGIDRNVRLSFTTTL